MWIDTNSARLLLKPQHALRLQHAEGTRLRAVQGTVWITIDNDRRDILLNPGESFVVDSSQALVALPLGPQATLDLCAARSQPLRSPEVRAGGLQRQVRTWLQGGLPPSAGQSGRRALTA